MKLIRKRLGFANNSSSSHSIVMLRDASGIEESGEDIEFGWNDFTLKSKHDKLSYLTTMLKSNNYTKEDVEEIGLGKYWQDDDDNYIDNQSEWSIPKQFGSNKPCKKFCEALIRYFNNDNTVVFGGNDNSEGHPDYEALEDIDKVSELNIPDYYGDSVCKVISDDLFVFFQQTTGDKKAYSFDSGVVDYTPSTPELIDIKITNFCNVKDICTFCYMGSTPKGQHASLDKIKELATAFAEMQVLEVALGGGETTQHPDFIKILRLFKVRGITPNFTTRNFEFFENIEPNVIKEILSLCGSFAFSVQDKAEAQRVLDIREKHDIRHGQIYLQIIPALFLDEVVKIFDLCNHDKGYREKMNVTFLGYKTTGRAGEYTDLYNQRELDLIKVIKSSKTYKDSRVFFGIDTLLANKLKDILKAEGISECDYYLEEGRFSYYVDAVENKMGRCSYTDDLFDYDINELKRHFKSIACIQKLKNLKGD